MMSPDIVEPERTSLAELGLDEAWLERWLQENPKRLGLGSSIRIMRAQIVRLAGSGTPRLDLQAVDETIEDRVYDIELQRGELDSDHGFRTLDYWAREEKRDDSEREHRPVIVAEQIRGSRYWTLLEVLAERLGLIALEVRAFKIHDQPAVLIEPVILPEDLRPDRMGEIHAVQDSLTEDAWRAKTTEDFQRFLDALARRAQEWGLAHTVVWSAKSYIGLWKGSRCWCPIWPRKDAMGRIYLPCPGDWDKASEDAPPAQFEVAKQELARIGVELVWSWKYNMGANPLAATIEIEDIDKPLVKGLLESAWRAL